MLSSTLQPIQERRLYRAMLFMALLLLRPTWVASNSTRWFLAKQGGETNTAVPMSLTGIAFSHSVAEKNRVYGNSEARMQRSLYTR